MNAKFNLKTDHDRKLIDEKEYSANHANGSTKEFNDEIETQCIQIYLSTDHDREFSDGESQTVIR